MREASTQSCESWKSIPEECKLGGVIPPAPGCVCDWASSERSKRVPKPHRSSEGLTGLKLGSPRDLVNSNYMSERRRVARRNPKVSCARLMVLELGRKSWLHAPHRHELSVRETHLCKSNSDLVSRGILLSCGSRACAAVLPVGFTKLAVRH